MIKIYLLIFLTISVKTEKAEDVQKAHADHFIPYINETLDACVTKMEEFKAQLVDHEQPYTPDDIATITKDSLKALLKIVKTFTKEESKGYVGEELTIW